MNVTDLLTKHLENLSPVLSLFVTISNKRKNHTNCNIFCIINITCIVQRVLKRKKFLIEIEIWEPLEVGLPA